MRVGVVGAGAAGLAAARELDREGHDIVIFEQRGEAGGLWNYDPTGTDPARPLYASLRTNLPRQLMAFRDYPFRGEEAFPAHTEVLAYLRRFAADFDLVRRIRFGSEVARMTVADGRWSVALTDDSTESFDAVVIANGHYRVPRLPEIAGLATFTGRAAHSSAYRRVDDIDARRALLVGDGASAVDLSLEIAASGTEVHIATRSGASDAARFPAAITHECLVAMEGATAIFADGSRLAGVEMLLYCTGYSYDVPFLPSDPTTAVWNADRVLLYLDLLSPAQRTLAFIGLPYRVIPFPQFEIQARWWARMLAGRFVPPAAPERAQWVRRKEQALADAGSPAHHYMFHGERQFAYHDELARQCGAEPLSDAFLQLHRRVSAERAANPSGYRDTLDDI